MLAPVPPTPGVRAVSVSVGRRRDGTDTYGAGRDDGRNGLNGSTAEHQWGVGGNGDRDMGRVSGMGRVEMGWILISRYRFYEQCSHCSLNTILRCL